MNATAAKLGPVWRLSLATTLLWSAPALALPGDLDTSFGAFGKVNTAFGVANDAARRVAIQADGKIVVAGTCSNGSNNDFCVARYAADGALDTTFSGDGKVATTIGTSPSYIDTVLLQHDGKIVATGLCYDAGSAHSVFCLARYNSNGSLDVSFDIDGRVQTQIGNYNASAYGGAVLQPDGKIIVAGFCDPQSGAPGYTFCLARFEANGALDTTFSTDGQVFTTVGNDNSYIVGIALQTDGKIVAAGRCQGLANPDFCIVRYHGTGALDTSFNADGRVISAIGSGNDNAEGLTIQPDGKIVVVGYCSNGSNDDFCVARYEGGPFGARSCSLDVDGDGRVLATTDMLITTRVALGVTGPAVIAGVSFAASAARDEWGTNSTRDIRRFLITQCGMTLP